MLFAKMFEKTQLEIVICYRMNLVVQNIEIDSCSFEQLVSGGNGILSILNTGRYDKIDKNGGFVSVLVGQTVRRGFAPSK